MGAKLGERLDTARTFANGTHPAILAAFYNGHPAIEESAPLEHRQPRFPVPDKFTPQQLAGNKATNETIDIHEHTGEAIHIYDGFEVIFSDTAIGPISVLIDTNVDVDPLLAGIIDKAQTLFKNHSNWNIDRRVFELSMLCFGNWGQKRYPLAAFKNPFSPPKFVLGELILTTDVLDIECAFSAFAPQVVGQKCGINISLHTGRGASFSPYRSEEGQHGWNLVQNGDKQIVVDWMLYPPNVARLFASTRRKYINEPDDEYQQYKSELYEEFCKTYGTFPLWRQELYPPTLEQYYQLQTGENPGLATRNTMVYWNDLGEYLGSCSIPGGRET